MTSRFEYEARHVYYLPQDVFIELEDAKPTYLIGSRGTGKTTLLKALSWDERLENDSLKKQLKEDPFRKRYIGVYLKAPEIQLEGFDSWLKAESDEIYGCILGYFFDLLWITLLADAVMGLIAHKIIEVPPEGEHETLRILVDEYGELLAQYFPNKTPYTLRDLSKACTKAAIEWQRTATARPRIASILNRLPTGQAGTFGRKVAKMLSGLCDKHSSGERWHFKVCIDETETLPPKQQLVLNTIVRLARWPLFPVLSFVSLPQDFTSTIIPALTLQKADRHLKVLDDMTDNEFRDLAEGVARVRIRHYLGRPRIAFDLNQLLGHWNANLLLESILRESANKEAARLLTSAERMCNEPFFDQKEFETDRFGADGKRQRVLPIYQTYLIEKMNLSVPSPKDERWKRRAQDSAELRKRIVAAFLSICSEYGRGVRYASAEVLLQLSDNCTRDFLAQMEAIYRSTQKPIEKFLSLRIPYSAQVGPLRNASIEKKSSLVKFGVRAPTDTGRLVDGLAQVTAFIQTHGHNVRHLRSSERGIFELDLEDADKLKLSCLVRVILDAAEAGFFRTSASDGKTLRFRVHTSLAAAYGFSYRGAYYPVRLSWNDVEHLIAADSQDAHASAVKDIGKKLIGQEIDDMPLFETSKSKL